MENMSPDLVIFLRTPGYLPKSAEIITRIPEELRDNYPKRTEK